MQNTSAKTSLMSFVSIIIATTIILLSLLPSKVTAADNPQVVLVTTHGEIQIELLHLQE